ncbi:MAG: esterase, partial [Bacteroidota bacterium]|nr:esterase [Bacteroidota bacterium]
MIWKVQPTLEAINMYPDQNMTSFLGIEMTEIGDDYISAKMPVDHRTKQPYGILHGGASCVLAETLGSIAGSLCVEAGKQIV